MRTAQRVGDALDLNDKLEGFLEEASKELWISQCDYRHFLKEVGDPSSSGLRHHLSLITGAPLMPL